MSRLSTSAIIDAPAESIWALLADFGNVTAWWPTETKLKIERVECEGEGVGMVRHIHHVGLPGCISERLDFLDPATMTLMLSIVGDRPGGMTAYVATGTIVALDPQRCRMDYCANVTTGPGKEKRVDKMLRATWTTMFEGLGSAASRHGV